MARKVTLRVALAPQWDVEEGGLYNESCTSIIPWANSSCCHQRRCDSAAGPSGHIRRGFWMAHHRYCCLSECNGWDSQEWVYHLLNTLLPSLLSIGVLLLIVCVTDVARSGLYILRNAPLSSWCSGHISEISDGHLILTTDKFKLLRTGSSNSSPFANLDKSTKYIVNGKTKQVHDRAAC